MSAILNLSSESIPIHCKEIKMLCKIIGSGEYTADGNYVEKLLVVFLGLQAADNPGYN